MTARAWAATALGLALATRTVGAQEALLPTTGWGMGSVLSVWHFNKPLPQAAGAVADLAEIAVPFRVRAGFGRWSVDLSGAAAFGAVHFGSASSASGGDDDDDRVVTIFGPTDVKLRVTGPLIGDNLLLTTGFNLPSGKVGLDGDETAALQAIGAPAVRMPVGAFGTGAGATVGLIRAFEGEEWAIALGGSVEQRSEYSPIALLASTGKSETRVTPGMAAHVTLGLDRTLGERRLSALIVGDVFSKDRVQVVEAGGPVGNGDYTLGPQVTVTSRLDFAASAWRESAIAVAARVRGQFSDSLGAAVAGSGGTYLEASVGGVRGGPQGRGFVIGVDGRWHSGLEFTDALVGAAVTSAGLTLGFERASGSTVTRFTIRGQYGTFDTGTAQSSGFGATMGLTVGGRRGAQ